MCYSLLTPIFGLFGVIVGAVLTYLFSVRAKDKELQKAFEIYQAQQAVKIAEFLSFWQLADPSSKTEDKLKLNQMSYEMSMWLPEDIYLELAKIITYQPDKKDPKDILISVRKLFKGKDDKLDAMSIVHF